MIQEYTKNNRVDIFKVVTFNSLLNDSSEGMSCYWLDKRSVKLKKFKVPILGPFLK